jgi:hypothetical protein
MKAYIYMRKPVDTHTNQASSFKVCAEKRPYLNNNFNFENKRWGNATTLGSAPIDELTAVLGKKEIKKSVYRRKCVVLGIIILKGVSLGSLKTKMSIWSKT